MMIHCKNCGQMNAKQSNFCRFCGKKFYVNSSPPPPPPQRQPQQTPEPKPPRPYSWKTDEFQVKETGSRPTEQMKDLPVPFLDDTHATRPLSLYQEHADITRNYRCPNCGTHQLPYSVRKISQAGWIVFAILLVLFFPLFWVGFLIREDAFVCPACNFRVN